MVKDDEEGHLQFLQNMKDLNSENPQNDDEAEEQKSEIPQEKIDEIITYVMEIGNEQVSKIDERMKRFDEL